MAVNAAALETYDSGTIREDLSDAENMISPTETPFISMIAGKGPKPTNTKHEWTVTELGAVDETNAVPEGEDAPSIDSPVLADRRWTFTQIMDKVVKVTDTSQWIDGAAGIEKLAKQISYKMKELKRDKEAIMTSGLPAAPGTAVGASTRKMAGFVAFIITNRVNQGVGGAAPTLSASPDGYPNAGPTVGTETAVTEDDLNAAMQAAWTEGGNPKYALVSPANKRLISSTFNGYATKYKQADDKKIVSSIDVYESDFGQLQIVPDRFLGNTTAGAGPAYILLVDPEHVKICEAQPTRQLELARTGHTQNRLIQWEGCLEVSNEKAHAVVADTTG